MHGHNGLLCDRGNSRLRNGHGNRSRRRAAWARPGTVNHQHADSAQWGRKVKQGRLRSMARRAMVRLLTCTRWPGFQYSSAKMTHCAAVSVMPICNAQAAVSVFACSNLSPHGGTWMQMQISEQDTCKVRHLRALSAVDQTPYAE